jgi:hypothetical protein
MEKGLMGYRIVKLAVSCGTATSMPAKPLYPWHFGMVKNVPPFTEKRIAVENTVYPCTHKYKCD